MSNFRRTRGRSKLVFVPSADIKNLFLQSPLFSHPKLVTRENDLPETTSSRFIDVPSAYNTSNGFIVGVFFCQDVTDHCTLAGFADSPLFVCRNHSTPPLLGSKHDMDSVASAGRMLTILGLWLAAQTARKFISHVSLQVYRKAGLDVHDISLASGSADVLGYEVSLANAYCSGTGKRMSRIRSVARTVSSRRRTSGRAMGLVRVFLGAQQSWCSLNP